MILKHRHSCIVVNELSPVLAFYLGLGFRTESFNTESWAGCTLTVIKLRDSSGATALELIRGPWRNHVCFEVDELPPGPYVHERITDEFHTVFIEDPEGNLIELTKIKEV